jgi:putative phosphonate metabolism protein
MSVRFAIYAAPGTRSAGTGAALREKAEQWLGRSVTGGPIAPGVPVGWTREAIDAITVNARRYGFHGTLKAPFRLAEGRSLGELDAAVAQFAVSRASAVLPRLSLARLDGFFALVPGTEAAELHDLADEVMTSFDCFRAPAAEAETARRNPAALTPRQRELLKAWGYPYVLDEFRFHLTVTDRIPDARRPEVEQTLHDWFAPLLGADVPVDALALFTEAEPGAPFRVHTVHPLRTPPSSQRPAGQQTAKEPDDARNRLFQRPDRPGQGGPERLRPDP